MLSRARPCAAHHAPWLLIAALVLPACADDDSHRHDARGELSSGGETEDDDVRELEARIAQLERELSATRGSSESRSTTIGTTGSGDLGEAGTFALTSSGASDSAETSAHAETAPGDRVTLRLHETRPMALPIEASQERLPVAAIPPVPLAVTTASPQTAANASAPTTAPRAAVVPPIPPTAFVASTSPAPVPPPTMIPAPAPPPPAPSESLEDYRAGLAHLTARRFEQAIGSLSAFLRDHPGSAQSDDALYWRATAYYALRRYREASVDYDRVVRIAPRGERAADALYHSALCARRLGDDQRARTFFARVRREYPDSVAARLAAREDTT